MPRVTNQASVAEVISADSVYSLSEFQSRMGLGIHAMRSCRRAGLPVKRVGRKAYIIGRDAIEFISKVGG